MCCPEDSSHSMPTPDQPHLIFYSSLSGRQGCLPSHFHLESWIDLQHPCHLPRVLWRQYVAAVITALIVHPIERSISLRGILLTRLVPALCLLSSEPERGCWTSSEFPWCGHLCLSLPVLACRCSPGLPLTGVMVLITDLSHTTP